MTCNCNINMACINMCFVGDVAHVFLYCLVQHAIILGIIVGINFMMQHLLIKHMLDVMHIERNVINILQKF